MERQTDYLKTWFRRGCNFDMKLFWGFSFDTPHTPQTSPNMKISKRLVK